jgi:hypothetical protein
MCDALCDGFQSKACCPIRNEIIRVTDTVPSSRRKNKSINMKYMTTLSRLGITADEITRMVIPYIR